MGLSLRFQRTQRDFRFGATAMLVLPEPVASQ